MTLRELHNLSLNCNTEQELSEYMAGCSIKTNIAAYPYTVLSPFYFDKDHKLKNVLTMTYFEKGRYNG